MGDAPAPKLPIQGKRNILITSALPYVNNVPHLGNIIGCVLSADVFARFCRLRGYNALYICGTDEYGTTSECKAKEENCTPREICDKYHEIHKQVYDWFGISFDMFGRTSTPQHTELCHTIFKRLWENNGIYEGTEKHLFCETCQGSLADRLVEGTCPTEGCNNDSTCGDQCDNCGKTYRNSIELKEPRCKTCQNTPVIREGEQLFLDLPKLEHKLRVHFDKMKVDGIWSQNAINITQAWFNEGLESRSICRDLKWGVTVPHENYKDKVLYVWFDAPIGYISITSCYTPEWEKWWKNPENVELFQFMGKDNVSFHTVLFPSALLGTGERWTLVNSISATEFLNYGSEKFSKSKGIGVAGNDVKDTKIPVEVWRYYLLSNRPEVSDTMFKWEDLQAKLNNELLSNLGNFINRVLSFIAKPPGKGFACIIPDAPDAESHPMTKELSEIVGQCVEQYIEVMEEVKLKQGLKIAMGLSTKGNAYLQRCQFWKLYKEDKPSCSIVMRTAVGLVHILACLLEPFIPSFSAEVFKQLNMPRAHISLSDGNVAWARRPWEIVPAGHKIGDPKPLFEELKSERVVALREKYSASQTDRRHAGAIADAAIEATELKLYPGEYSGSQAGRLHGRAIADAAIEAAELLKITGISG
ncbi:Probable methionine--tRNA ligase [Striga hermonthica]|uniref:methionine--tRNA ligase n=1 Tax=Striga hermonthica TaxID=68872 RepID=A0A9N7R423_STRHE|nr:Probable methionine--tRNA ligase [Striga hermonthica]